MWTLLVAMAVLGSAPCPQPQVDGAGMYVAAQAALQSGRLGELLSERAYAVGLELLRAAADAGHLPAQERRARLVISTNYQAGPIRSSQRRTYVEALTWLAVALRRGYEPAQQILPHAIGQRLTGEAPKARVTRDEPFSDLPVTWIDAASKRAARLFRCWPVAGKRP